jgi:signal peptidase I
MSFKKKLKWLDPFTYLDLLLLRLFGEPTTVKKKIYYWICYIIFAFICAYLLYSLIGLCLGVNMPLAVVVSESMVPNLSRGDIVIITKAKDLDVQKIKINEDIGNKDLKEFADIEYTINENNLEEVKAITIGNIKIEMDNTLENDIIVYYSNTQHKDIVHRIIAYIEAKDGIFVLTKGDNNKTNRIIDQDCNIVNGIIKNNCLNKYPTPINSVKGKIIGRIPYLGYYKLI